LQTAHRHVRKAHLVRYNRQLAHFNDKSFLQLLIEYGAKYVSEMGRYQFPSKEAIQVIDAFTSSPRV
jgi:hypothetical protein